MSVRTTPALLVIFKNPGISLALKAAFSEKYIPTAIEAPAIPIASKEKMIAIKSANTVPPELLR